MKRRRRSVVSVEKMSMNQPRRRSGERFPLLLPTSSMATSFIFSYDAATIAEKESVKYRRSSHTPFWRNSHPTGKLFGHHVHQPQLPPSSPPVSPKRSDGSSLKQQASVKLTSPSHSDRVQHQHQQGTMGIQQPQQSLQRSRPSSSSCVHVSKSSELQRWEVKYRAQSARPNHAAAVTTRVSADGSCGFVSGSALGGCAM